MVKTACEGYVASEPAPPWPIRSQQSALRNCRVCGNISGNGKQVIGHALLGAEHTVYCTEPGCGVAFANESDVHTNHKKNFHKPDFEYKYFGKCPRSVLALAVSLTLDCRPRDKGDSDPSVSSCRRWQVSLHLLRDCDARVRDVPQPPEDAWGRFVCPTSRIYIFMLSTLVLCAELTARLRLLDKASAAVDASGDGAVEPSPDAGAPLPRPSTQTRLPPSPRPVSARRPSPDGMDDMEEVTDMDTVYAQLAPENDDAVMVDVDDSVVVVDEAASFAFDVDSLYDAGDGVATDAAPSDSEWGADDSDWDAPAPAPESAHLDPAPADPESFVRAHPPDVYRKMSHLADLDNVVLAGLGYKRLTVMDFAFCDACNFVVHPAFLWSHAMRNHQRPYPFDGRHRAMKPTDARVALLARDAGLRALSISAPFTDTPFALEGVEVADGFVCTHAGCRFASRERKTVVAHLRAEHPGLATAQACKAALVQAGDAAKQSRWYFQVKARRRPLADAPLSDIALALDSRFPEPVPAEASTLYTDCDVRSKTKGMRSSEWDVLLKDKDLAVLYDLASMPREDEPYLDKLLQSVEAYMHSVRASVPLLGILVRRWLYTNNGCVLSLSLALNALCPEPTRRSEPMIENRLFSNPQTMQTFFGHVRVLSRLVCTVFRAVNAPEESYPMYLSAATKRRVAELTVKLCADSSDSSEADSEADSEAEAPEHDITNAEIHELVFGIFFEDPDVPEAEHKEFDNRFQFPLVRFYIIANIVGKERDALRMQAATEVPHFLGVLQWLMRGCASWQIIARVVPPRYERTEYELSGAFASVVVPRVAH